MVDQTHHTSFKTCQVCFSLYTTVHTVLSSHPGNPQKTAIQRYTYNDGEIINEDHFCIFSYNTMFNVDPNLVGTPGSILAHELGHYFGLLHPFSGGCTEIKGSDKIADTPPAEGQYWYVTDSGTPQEHLLITPCENAPHSCNGKRRLIENIMDYGPCRWLFTEGQVKRMTDRINTKPTLFDIHKTYDSRIDPTNVTIYVNDERHLDLRRKRDLTAIETVNLLHPDL